MKIAVYDLPASESGALAILKDFYAYVQRLDKSAMQWVFFVSTDTLRVNEGDTGRIEIQRFPSVKKSWLDRLKFELLMAPRLARECGADVVFSLQNIAILGLSLPQVVYVHQSLPYIGKRFSYFRRNERFLAAYADIFRVLIGWSVRKAASVVVQTSWFKEALVARHGIPAAKIAVIPPSLDICIPAEAVLREPSEFFYPTTAYVYKNLDVLVEAVRRLRTDGFSPKIALTITGRENSYAREFCAKIRALGLNECFSLVGRIPREEVLRLYRRTTLLFPSRLESFGLPLLEARTVEAPIIASDTPFAREILAGYSRARFCGESDAAAFAEAMKAIMSSQKSMPLGSVSAKNIEIKTPARWGEVVDLLVAAGLNQ